MITFTHDTTRYTVKPENAQAYRKLAAKPAKHKPTALSSKNLTRQYPAFFAGMTTSEYVATFQSQFKNLQHPLRHDCANYYNAAPMLDAITPEVVEELDPDYTPPPPKVKKGKARAVHLIKCIRDDLLFYTDNPAEFSPEYFHDLLRCADEALENLK
jgi:hypothetical protein